MDLWKEIISIIVSNGIFAILFVWLFVYQLKDSSKREEKYQQTISDLTSRLQVLDNMEHDLNEIKDFLKGGDDFEELL